MASQTPLAPATDDPFHLALFLVFALILGNRRAAAHQDNEQEKDVSEGSSHGVFCQLRFPAASTRNQAGVR